MIISPASCVFYRITGSFLISTSAFTIILTFRYFFHRYRRQKKGLTLLPVSPVLIGMLVSLMLILCTGIPVVLIQCMTCRPFKTYAGICRMNGFICFAIGNFHMYMLVLLSIFRYINIVHKSTYSNYFSEHYRGLSVFICAIISLCWALPPLLNVGNAYTDEGIGFYCSLDWNNSAFQSRIFLYALLICNYFLLLFILIYANLRIYFVLRHLLKSSRSSNSPLVSTILHVPIGYVTSSSNLMHHSSLESSSHKHLSDQQLKQKLNRLQRLKMDQRYARITAIMVGQFIIAWTPYAILALIIINGGIEFVRQYPMFSTVSELMAKFSLIFNPLILIYTNKMREH